jgi:hypothetical protein
MELSMNTIARQASTGTMSRRTSALPLPIARELHLHAAGGGVPSCRSTVRFVGLSAVAILVLAFGPSIQAETTVPAIGIGTSLTGEFTINTHADSVTYSGPVAVVIRGMPVLEIRGTVSGVGWGGTGIVDRAENAHYHYDIPFVARWRSDAAHPRLVFYHHGGPPPLIAVVKNDKLAGAANPNRFAELIGDLLVGVPALLDHATYIAVNRRGMRGDGRFSATYLPPVPPLTAAEVATIKADLASAPGNPGFVQPGIAVGAPVAVAPSMDVPTYRDIARALEHVVAGIQGTHFRTRVAFGGSAGARLLAGLDFGRSGVGTRSVRTGGNHVVPYNSGSPRIFDGFILNGFPYMAGIENADKHFPLSAPVMFLQGQGDERYQQHVTMAHELLQKGVSLKGRVWLYEIKNLTHGTRDNPYNTPTPLDGDRLGCFASAAIRNMRALLEEHRAPPISTMTGRIVAGALRFDQARGTTTNVAPVLNDPTIDTIVVDPNLTPRTIGGAETARWLAVTAVLPRTGEALTPPTVACRLGGYRLMFFGSQLVPYASADLLRMYGSFEGYRQCVSQKVASLEAQSLYDPRVESALETAERARGLFTPASTSTSRCDQRASSTPVK